ncbi:MAG: TylF/MycF/NovP-related O-methyltransferase [Candidatus Solibacter sp.]
MKQQATLVLKRLVNSLPMLRLIRRCEALSENRLAERGMIAQAFEFIRLNQIRGDYLEFGLWQGKTFLHARRMKKLYGIDDMHLWGFDSFHGLPAVPGTSAGIWTGGQFACTQQNFTAIMASQGLEREEYTLVPGFYDTSLNAAQHAAMKGRKAALVYIDCDLYESTVPVMNFIEPYLITGTIVCFDDFFCYAGSPEYGEQRALGEFLETHPDLTFQRYLTYCPVGQSFIVNRRSTLSQGTPR